LELPRAFGEGWGAVSAPSGDPQVTASEKNYVFSHIF